MLGGMPTSSALAGATSLARGAIRRIPGTGRDLTYVLKSPPEHQKKSSLT